MISLQKASFATFKKPNLRKNNKTRVKSSEYDDVKKYEENVLSVFKNAESIEKINGRVAQVGWSLALYYELSKQESVWNQVFNTRTFTLGDGVTDTVTYPSGGFFIIPILSILILPKTAFQLLSTFINLYQFLSILCLPPKPDQCYQF